MSSSANFLLELHKYYVHYRPNIRPNYSVKLAEYSVSADTTFCGIGRTLTCMVNTAYLGAWICSELIAMNRISVAMFYAQLY